VAAGSWTRLATATRGRSTSSAVNAYGPPFILTARGTSSRIGHPRASSIAEMIRIVDFTTTA
jgi:hypothetical protein